MTSSQNFEHLLKSVASFPHQNGLVSRVINRSMEKAFWDPKPNFDIELNT